MLKHYGASNKTKKTTKVNTFYASFELGNTLVMPLISQRKISGLQKPVLMKIDYVLPIEPEIPKPALKKTHEHHRSRGRCRICLGHCTTKAEKNNMKCPTHKQNWDCNNV